VPDSVSASEPQPPFGLKIDLELALQALRSVPLAYDGSLPPTTRPASQALAVKSTIKPVGIAARMPKSLPA
jgi:hypothetical protein